VILPATGQQNKILSLALSNKKNQLWAMRHKAELIFGVKTNQIFFCEFESIFKTALGHESWDTGKGEHR
jgi:hypothetical protein